MISLQWCFVGLKINIKKYDERIHKLSKLILKILTPKVTLLLATSFTEFIENENGLE